MSDDHRKSIETLIELAGGFDASGCWDPERAEELLRQQSNPEEALGLGAEPALIERIWPSKHE